MSTQAQADFDENATRRDYVHPHSGRHPIPTIQGYRQHRKELEDQLRDEKQAQEGPEDQPKHKRAWYTAKAIINDDEQSHSTHNPYPSTNRNYLDDPSSLTTVGEKQGDSKESNYEEIDKQETTPDKGKSKKDDGPVLSAAEAVAGTIDPKQKRKAMKKSKRQGRGREVTDPITHLPTIIHDQTEKDLASAPENVPEPGDDHWTATGPQGAAKTKEELQEEQIKIQNGYNGMQRLFPPPDFEDTKRELALVQQRALTAGLGVVGLLSAVTMGLLISLGTRASSATAVGRSGILQYVSAATGLAVSAGLGVAAILGLGRWTEKKTNDIFDDEVWDASRSEERAILNNNEELPESTQWLNALISSIWPLINPELFASLVDQIEDVMQASLPKMIKMVSVDDMGQGNEAIRILGMRVLPSGAASQAIDSEGNLQNENRPSQSSDEVKDGSSTTDEGGTDAAKGMEAEGGDYINCELALAYRSRSSGKSMKAKAKNAHLYLKFYLPGGIAVPIWVELRGIIMTLRLRLQLTPDPPFISTCTLSFMGQPKASMSCVPLSRESLNVMDVPLISSFVQSAIDAALAEFVAPKSMTLNLKDMLVGEDFKKNTVSLGVVWVLIKRARGFKEGDSGIGPMKGSSDSYVTVSWGKFGKPVASTRIIVADGVEPSWHEYASILVTPEEINAEEKLRIQLWDSDKWSADDDLGRVELDLKSLMNDPATCNKIQDREDRLQGQDPDEKMPGSLDWSVGYFAKTRILPQQLEKQTLNQNIRTKEGLKKYISETSENKLREANKAPNDEEVMKLKAQDYREMEDAMIVTAPPSTEFPSGILSVQIHNITGLEVAKLQKANDDGDGEDEMDQAGDMPDSYCNIIINHRKSYRTRTKPKNSKPFFNAGTERFIRDWRSTEVIVAVRDARERENDPLMGIVFLPLAKVFAEKSQVMDFFPLVGGVGYGRVRISMVWRSVEIKLPPNLIGWDYGTLQICGAIKPRPGLPEDISKHRIKMRTNLGRAKIHPENGQWQRKSRKGDVEDIFLAVRRRYACPLVIEVRRSVLGPDQTSAFAVLWLGELTDEKDETRTIKVWKGGKDKVEKACTNYEYNGIEEGEQPLGELELNFKFWQGLSGYHKSYASQAGNMDMYNVMECLDTITDEKLDGDSEELLVEAHEDDDDADSDDEKKGGDGDQTRKKKLRVHTNDSSSSESESDDDDDSDGSNPLKKMKAVFKKPIEDGPISAAAAVVAPGHNDPDDGERGIRSSIRDYKDHHKQIHRRHRGVMQWRAVREADYLGTKLGGLKGSISGIFHHDDKSVGVETEV